MTRLCRDVETVLGRPAHTLSEAERLQLEHHLSECAECRDVSALSRTVTNIIQSAPRPLSESARERAIAGAFECASQALPIQRAAHWGPRTGFALAAAALLLLGVRVWHATPERDDVIANATPGLREHPSLHDTGGAPANPGRHSHASSAEAWLESTSGETRQFAGARVRLAAATRVRFLRVSNTLELSSGEVTLDVEHQRERAFAVLTQDFRVEVLGTQFVVSPEHVAVFRGRVQVRERESNALIADLRAGQSYTRPATAPASGSRATAMTAGSKTLLQQPARKTSPQYVGDNESVRLPSVVDTDTTATPSESVSASELIRQTRAALGGENVNKARALLQRAEQVAQHADERAEVGMLQAECELLARKPDAAVRAYLRVADRFAALGAGENALFAAAQLRLRGRDTGAARALFERYVVRYPQGRFADEARAHLAAR